MSSRAATLLLGLMPLALPLSACPGAATFGPRVEAQDLAPREVERLGNGARYVEWSGMGPELELALLVLSEPEVEPLGLEGASGLLVALALDGAGEPGGGQGDGGDDASPRARALALGARLEAHADGALIGWRLVLAPCDGCRADRLERAWELLLDLALAPELRASTVTRRAEQLRDRLLARVDTMESAAWRWAAALAVGMGRPAGSTPTEESAAHTHREAMVRLHRALMNPERMLLVGPGLDEKNRARLKAWTTQPASRIECVAPPQLGFGLAGAGAVKTVVARRAPGPGVMGRDELEAALVAARRDPALRGRRVELVDLGGLGGSSALVELAEDGAMPFEAWLEAAKKSTMSAMPTQAAARDAVAVAREALFGRAPAGVVTLGQAVTVWWGEAERFPTLPVMLPREAPICRGR